jgi:hypothetical protein
MSDLKAPTYEDRSPVGRAFMVRHFIFSRSDIEGQVFSSPGRMPLSQYTHDKITATAV